MPKKPNGCKLWQRKKIIKKRQKNVYNIIIIYNEENEIKRPVQRLLFCFFTYALLSITILYNGEPPRYSK